MLLFQEIISPPFSPIKNLFHLSTNFRSLRSFAFISSSWRQLIPKRKSSGFISLKSGNDGFINGLRWLLINFICHSYTYETRKCKKKPSQHSNFRNTVMNLKMTKLLKKKKFKLKKHYSKQTAKCTQEISLPSFWSLLCDVKLFFYEKESWLFSKKSKNNLSTLSLSVVCNLRTCFSLSPLQTSYKRSFLSN